MAALWKCFKRSYNLTQHSGQTDYTEGQHVPAFAEALPMPTDCTSLAQAAQKWAIGTWEVPHLQFSFKVGLGGMSYPAVKAVTVVRCTPSYAVGHRAASDCLARGPLQVPELRGPSFFPQHISSTPGQDGANRKQHSLAPRSYVLAQCPLPWPRDFLACLWCCYCKGGKFLPQALIMPVTSLHLTSVIRQAQS